MKIKSILSLPLILIAFTSVFGGETPAEINLGKFTEERISEIIEESVSLEINNRKIDYISEQFLDVPYKENVLIGDVNTNEVLTVNLAGLDCFTYIDYVEAIRLSSKYNQLLDNIIDVRYKNQNVSYPSRNHFFSDWVTPGRGKVRDITSEIGGMKAVEVEKSLNKKEDGSFYLPEIPVVKRTIFYIPSENLDQTITEKLRTGDYIGIYSENAGLDVSHTGILIKKNGRMYLRHASSRKSNRRVVDEDFLKDMENKPGVVIYRPI